MRNLLYTLLLLFAGQAMMAQSQEITGIYPGKTLVMAPSAQKAAMVADTLDDYLQRATAFYTLTSGTGYVLGTNTNFLETAVHYDNPGGPTVVNEALLFCALKQVMGAGADSITINVYAAGPDSMPLGLPISVGKFSVDDADTSGFATFVPLTSSAPAAGGFLVSMVHALSATVDDTIAVFSSNVLAQGGGPDGNMEKRTRQNTTSGWIRSYDFWTIANANYDADAMIVPIVDVSAVGVDPQVQSSFQLFRSYPNPAVNELRIPYAIDATQPVSLTLIDATGRIIYTQDAGEMGAGAHEMQLNTSELAAGSYYFILNAGGQMLGGKFMHAR